MQCVIQTTPQVARRALCVAVFAGSLLATGAILAESGEGLHPFITKGGPVDASVLEEIATTGGAHQVIVPAADDRRERNREHKISREISPLANSDAFTEPTRPSDEVVDRPFKPLNRLLGFDNTGKTATSGSGYAPAGTTVAGTVQPQTQPRPVINPLSTGGLSQSDVFTQSDRPSEATREHSFNLF